LKIVIEHAGQTLARPDTAPATAAAPARKAKF
jgi:hypothetical protein